MPPILTTAAKIMCAHGGQVTLIPKQVKVLCGGQPVLCVGDLVGSPIVGCAQPPTPATAPCLVVASEIPIPMVGMNPKVLVGGKPVLLGGINGVTSGVPPSSLIVAFPGQVKAQA
ncbi:MAG TPA: hypothetical protein VL120_00215 [Solirubrobacteraceae bacterium]|jgi:hypothetical protein|nr:hypothetical protein [Solirubrobacteraceae bacterium]